MRRIFGLVVLVALGCDRAEQAEIEALRAELGARSLAARDQAARIDALTTELEEARAGRLRCETEWAAAIARDPSEPPADGPGFAPNCAEGRCVVSRAQVEAMLDDPAGLVRAARIIPELKDGEVRGMKLFGIRPGSPLAALGLRNGDMVHSIGEVELDGLERLMQAGAQLRTQSRVRITGARKDGPLELILEIE